MLSSLLDFTDPAIASLYIAGITGLIAAGALYYAKKAPEKRDLERVEMNTADTAQRLEQMHTELAENTAKTNERLDGMENHLAQMGKLAREQSAREALNARAQRVSITAMTGMVPVAYPMEITLTLMEADVVPTRVEPFSESGSFGSFPCNAVRQGCWSAKIQPRQVNRWYASGFPVDDITYRRRVKLRIYMLIEEQEVHRDFAAQLECIDGTFTLDGSY